MMRWKHGMINCAEFDAFIVDYLDGALPPKQQGRFNRHMKLCPGCLDYLTEYQQTIKLHRDTFADMEAPVPEEVPEELINAVLEARKA